MCRVGVALGCPFLWGLLVSPACWALSLCARCWHRCLQPELAPGQSLRAGCSSKGLCHPVCYQQSESHDADERLVREIRSEKKKAKLRRTRTSPQVRVLSHVGVAGKRGLEARLEDGQNSRWGLHFAGPGIVLSPAPLHMAEQVGLSVCGVS